MNRFLFTWKNGDFEPVPPTEEERDGVMLLDIDDVIERAPQWTRATLEKKWLAAFGDIAQGAAKPTTTLADLIGEAMDSPLKFEVNGYVYRTFITAERLIDDDGRPAMGRLISVDGLILISSHFPPNTWRETWFHEVSHAMKLHYPKPTDEEGATIWETTYALKSGDQFKMQGGTDTLLSMKPIAGVAPARVCEPTKFGGRSVLVRRKFGFLSEYQFAAAEELWQQYGLNPLLGHFSVRVEQGEVRIIPRLAGVMAIVMHAPGFVSNPERHFEWVDGSRLPISCTSTVERDIGGKRLTFKHTVLWDDIFGDDPTAVDSTILAYPMDSLGARADIRVLRTAYADTIGNLAIDEEERRPRLARDAARTDPDARNRRDD